MIVNIPHRVMLLARQQATGSEWSNGDAVQRIDSSWDIDLPERTLRRLEQFRVNGETTAEVIERVLFLHSTGWRAQ